MSVDKKHMINKVKRAGGKNLREAKNLVGSTVLRSLSEGIETLQGAAYTKFDSTLEVVMKLGVDPRHSDQMVRGVVALPAGTGKVTRVAVICKDEKIEEADKSLLDFVTLHFDADNDISRQKFYQLQITTGSVRGDKIRLLDFYETRIKEECSK